MVHTQMLVPTIFFLGAGFVWVSATLALPTAADVRRVSRLEYENITDPLTGPSTGVMCSASSIRRARAPSVMAMR